MTFVFNNGDYEVKCECNECVYDNARCIALLQSTADYPSERGIS